MELNPPPGPPDPVALRRVAVPDVAPPYDGEQAPTTAAPASGDATAPGGAWAADLGQASPVQASPIQASQVQADPARSGDPAGPPGPGGWPSQFAQVLAETLAGSRPPQQLNRWTTAETRQRIRQLGPLLASGQQPRVRRVMTSVPAPDVLELTAVVGFGPRVRVLALRLERADEVGLQWRCTEIESA
jgi:hypothetical protein